MNERTPIFVVAVVLVVLVAAGILATGDRTVSEFDVSTPEGTVQAYLQAVVSGDREGSAAYLAADPEDPCLREPERGVVFDDLVDARIALGQVEIGEDAATVEVRVTRIAGDLATMREDARFHLVRSGDGWLIDAADWPFGCGPVPTLEES